MSSLKAQTRTTRPVDRGDTPGDRVPELLCAIAHEVGNHLGGVRMQAYLLDEDLDAHGLAAASVALDELASRAAPLLSLVRPLVTGAGRAPAASSLSALLEGLRGELEEEGLRGVRLSLDVAPGAAKVPLEAEWLHPLLKALVGATLTHVGRSGRVTIGCGPAEGTGASAAQRAGACEWVVRIEDDGEAEDLVEDEAALRGRPLAVAIARALLARVGGQVEVTRGGAGTRIALGLPSSSSSPPPSSS